MAKKNDTQILLLSLILCLGIIGFGLWWFLRPGEQAIFPGGTETVISSESEADLVPVQERLSRGERLLIEEGATPEKRKAIAEIGAQNWSQAIANLEASLALNPNDPEALIYLNNARIAQEKHSTLAVVVPIGTQLNGAQELLRGVAQAQQEINQNGGIQGTPIQILIADDRNSPEIGVQIAQTLVADDRVLGVIGHFSSQVSLEVAPVYQQGKLVMVSATSTSVDLSGAGSYIFRTVPSDRFTGNTLSRYLLDTLQKTKVAVFYNSQSNYSQSLKDELTTALFSDGGEVVAEFDLSTVMFSASNGVKQAISQAAEAIVLVSDSTVLAPALEVVVTNDRQLPIVAGDSLYKSEVLQTGGENVVGMVVAIPWHILAESESDFAQTSLQLWKGAVNWRTALAYDATQVLGKGLANQPTRSGIQQALSAPEFTATGASGTLQFLPSGDRNRTLQLVEVQPGTQTQWGYDFVPIGNN